MIRGSYLVVLNIGIARVVDEARCVALACGIDAVAILKHPTLFGARHVRIRYMIVLTPQDQIHDIKTIM